MLATSPSRCWIAAVLLVVISEPLRDFARTAEPPPSPVWPARGARADERNRPPERAREANHELRDLYRNLDALPTEECARKLLSGLGELEALDDTIAGIRDAKCGIAEARWLRDSEEQRALAWIHGWTILGELVIRAHSRGSKAKTPELVRLDAESPMRILMRVYAQMTRSSERLRKCSGSADPNPLRLRLARPGWGEWHLSYRQRWTQRPPGMHGRYYIPSTAAILGAPSDAPALDDKRFLSLWALTNLRLDAQLHPGTESDGKLELEPLSEWLNGLARALESESFGSDAHLRKRAAGRFDRIASFLSFRAKVSEDKSAVRNMARKVADARRRSRNGHLRNCLAAASRKDSALEKLLFAAGEEDGERVVEAAIWLRYVVLLSYQREGWRLDFDGGRSELDTLLGGGGSRDARLLLERDEALAPDETRYLRWNQWPARGDVSDVVYQLCAATYGFLEFQREIDALDGARFVSQFESGGPSSRSKYATSLEAALGRFRRRIQKDVNVEYQDAAIPPSRGESVRAAQGPLEFAVRKSLRESLRPTAVGAEWRQLEADLRGLSDRTADAIALHRRCVDAYSRNSPHAVSRALVAFAAARDAGHLFDPPNRSFRYHAERLAEACAEVDKKWKSSRIERELVANFEIANRRARVSELELQAARYALDVAERARGLCDLYEEIALLEAEAAELRVQVRELERKAEEGGRKAKHKLVLLATRARDTAKAQLDGLLLALRDAERIVEDAKKKIEKLAGQLKVRANRIEDEERSILGFVRSIVKVVGYALAPFTGGASVKVASIVDSTIKSIDTIAKASWSGIDNIANNLIGFADSQARIADSVIHLAGDGEDKKRWAKCKSDFRKMRRDVAEAARGFSDETKAVLSKIGGLSRNGATNFMAALGADLPLKFKNGRIDLSGVGKKLKIEHEGLEKHLKEILDAGGVFVVGLKERTEWFSEDGKFKKDLRAALQDMVATAPPEVFDAYRRVDGKVRKAQASYKGFRDDVEEKVEDLSKFLEGSSKARDALQTVLEGGMALVRAEGKDAVVALVAPIQEEVKRLQSRANAARNQAITQLTKTLETEQARLNDRARGAKTPKELRGVAKQAEDSIPKIDRHLGELQAEVEKAKAALADAQDRKEIARLEEEASLLRVEASVLEVAISEKARVAAQRRLRLVREQRDLRDLEVQRFKKEVAAATEKVKADRWIARHRKYECLNWGIDPESYVDGSDGRWASPFDRSARLDLVGVLARGEERAKGSFVFRDVLRHYVGLIRWLQLFGVTISDRSKRMSLGGASPIDWYLSLAKLIEDPSGGAGKTASEIRSRAQILEEVFGDHASRATIESASPAPREPESHSGRRIRWSASLWKKGLQGDVFDPVADTWVQLTGKAEEVVGAIEYTVGTSAEKKAEVKLFSEKDAKDSRKFTLLDFIALEMSVDPLTKSNGGTDPLQRSLVPANFRFLVKPPVAPRSNPYFCAADPSTWRYLVSGQAVRSLDSKIYLKKMRQDLGIGQHLRLSGVLGTWTVYILSTDLPKMPEKDRADYAAAIRQRVRFEVYHPCLSITLPHDWTASAAN